MNRKYIVLLGIWCLWLMLGWAAAAPPAKAPPPPQVQFLPQAQTPMLAPLESVKSTSVFYRRPWRFDLSTFEKVAQDITYWSQQPFSWHLLVPPIMAKQPWYVWFLWVIFTMVGLFFSLHIQRQLGHLSQQEAIGPHWLIWLRHLCLLLVSRSIPWLCLLFLNQLLAGYTPDYTDPQLMAGLLWLGLLYQIGKTGLTCIWADLGETLFPRLLPVVRRQYLRISCRLLMVAVWVLGGIHILEYSSYNPDFVEFLRFVLTLFCFTLVFGFMTRKKALFEMLPLIDEPVYERGLKWLDQFYSYALGFTLVLVFLWLTGFQNLARLLFVRSWVLVAVALGAVVLYRWLVQKWGSGNGHGSDEKLNHEILYLALLAEGLGVFYLVLSLLDLYPSFVSVLSYPLVAVGKSHLSVWSLLHGMLVFWLFLTGSKMATLLLEKRVYPYLQWDIALTHMANTTVRYFLLALGLLMALNSSGFDLSLLAIFAGALGVGIGFGLQNIAKNVVSGMVLIFGRLVKKGDYITVGNHSGYVQDLDWKRVHLKTTEHLDLIVPTAYFVESAIVNWTYSETIVRVHIPIQVGYQSDPELVRELLLQTAQQHEQVLAEPTPDVWLLEFGQHGLQFELLVWVDYRHITEKQLKGELNFAILRLLKAHHIQIHLPQRAIYLDTLEIPADSKIDWPEG